MTKCPLFSMCGGCKYDFTAPDYCEKKLSELPDMQFSDEPFWTPAGARRRADLCFANGEIGFYARGTKNIVPVKNCPNLVPEINTILPRLARVPWSGAGSVLVTLCDNGIDIAVESNVPYFSREFHDAVQKIGALRVTWNGSIVCQTVTPKISFGSYSVDYPVGAFLQPTVESEKAMRNFVIENAEGAKHAVDLFCGIGNFTFALNAAGFDIAGIGVKRDLFARPLTAKALNQYDCAVMDPPRAGAEKQSRELARSGVARVIYVSCNPKTFERDAAILIAGGYKLQRLRAFDQFVGSVHWEIIGVFCK